MGLSRQKLAEKLHVVEKLPDVQDLPHVDHLALGNCATLTLSLHPHICDFTVGKACLATPHKLQKCL